MDETSSDSDIYSQVDDVKYIQIKNFSCVQDCQNEHIHFVRKKHFYGQLYAVHIYPNGISCENQGYVSIKVSKVLKDPDVIPDVGYDSITWTFSVVDINGDGRYYQSVAKESVVNIPYQLEIPKFLTRSFVVEHAEELLVEDTLTIRCEVSFVFYSVQALHEDLVFEVNPYDENFTEDSLAEESLETCFDVLDEEESEDNFMEQFEKGLNLDECSENDDDGSIQNFVEDLNRNEASKNDLSKGRNSYDTEEDITYYILIMLGFLHEYSECKQKPKLNMKDLGFQMRLLSKILANTDDVDEVAKTYMWTNPVFRVYNRLKLKVKDIMINIPLEISEKENLESEKYNLYPLYTQASSGTFLKSYTVMNKIFEAVKRVTNFSGECTNKHSLSTEEYNYLRKIVSEVSEVSSMWEYLFEAIKSDESTLSAETVTEQDISDLNYLNDTDWNFQIQTKDGVIFNIPFEKGKETFGTKLVASSPVFETMLKNPMSERFSKKVQLSDIDFRTFRNFLLYLQGNGVIAGSFTELCDLYRDG